jgi:Ca-activated chloride channel family protein
MDRWTAASIYEDIVNRRRDPSILYKRGNGDYELRIFPMAGNSSRKVKISYLMPNQWKASSVNSLLPTNLLQASYYQVPKLSVLTWLNQNWKNPKILELPSVSFQSKEDSLFGNYFEADIPSGALHTTLNFNVDAPVKEGIYVSKYLSGAESYYQMILLPSKALNISASQKVAFLIDYDASKSTVSKSELINNLKSNILTNFSSKDSFNLIFSKVNIQRIGQNWIPADSTIVDSIFQNIGEDQIANYSILPSLLADGIDFVKEGGNDGNIVLLSNSDQVGEYTVANALIDDLQDLTYRMPSIHVVNFQNQNFNYHWFGGRYYVGNEYFYLNITRITGANYFDIYTSNSSFSEQLSSAFQSLSGFISSFDLHTTLSSGFCYGRYNLNPTTTSVYLNKPIVQIGKFRGNLPFIIEVSGVYKSEPFTQSFNLGESMVDSADSLTEEMWAGNYIKFLENQVQSNDIINEIIYYSINERVLSIYSAFLCLEPGQGGEVCYDCLDESGSTDIIDSLETIDSLSLNAFPNPFNNQINLNVKLPPSIKSEELIFRVYDILGQLVKTFDPDISAERREFKFVWDGKNDNGVYLSSGNYFFVVSTPKKIFTLKLLLMK